MSSTLNIQGHGSSDVPPSLPQNHPSAPNEPSTNTSHADPLSEREKRVYNAFKDACTAKLEGPPPVIPLSEDRSHWARTFDCIQKHDTVMCRGLNAALDNLLIFIGLFSGVVSAFTIESYRWLQPESTDLTTSILLQVSAQLANPTLAPVATIPDSFSPSSSSRKINILWFLSLTIALLDALLAILCKQWLQEYEKDVSSLPYEAAMALRQLRFEAFKYWKVDKIITSLPVILQISLLLFLAGVLQLLWTLDQTLAAIITSIVGVGFMFVLATTCIPVIVAVINDHLYHLATRDSPELAPDPERTHFDMPSHQQPFDPIPLCAYKSPQSWLLVKLFFQWITGSTMELFWMHLEGRWLSFQNVYERKATEFTTYRHPISRALYWVDQHYGASPRVLVDLYHCFSETEVINVIATSFQKLDPFRNDIHDFEEKPLPGEWIPLAFMSFNEDMITRIPKAPLVIGERLIRYIRTSWIGSSTGHRPDIDAEVCVYKTLFYPLVDFFDCDKHPLTLDEHPLITKNGSIGPASAASESTFYGSVWSASLSPTLKFIFECHTVTINNTSDFMLLERNAAILFGNMKACLERICREDAGNKSFHLRFWMEAIIESFKFVQPAVIQEPKEALKGIPISSRELPWWRRHTIRQLLGLELHASRENGGMEEAQAEGSKASPGEPKAEDNATFVNALRASLKEKFAPMVSEETELQSSSDKRRIQEFTETLEKIVRVRSERLPRMVVPLMERIAELSKDTPDVSVPEGWEMLLEGCRVDFVPDRAVIPDLPDVKHLLGWLAA